MRIHEFLETQASSRPDAIALLDRDGTAWSFAKEWQAAQAGADLLRLAGVQHGDRVLMVTENCASLCAFIYACSLIGAWAVPVNARQTADELKRIIHHAAPRVVLFMSEVSPDAKAHGETLGARDVHGAWGNVMMAELGANDTAPDSDVAVMLYTTGTTGTPKGVMLTQSNLVFAGKTSANTRSMRKDDIVYGALPMTHVFGLASMLMAATYAGATIQLEARFSAAKLHAALINGVTILPAVPQMHALLMQYTAEQGMR